MLHHGDDEVGEPGRVPTPERNTIMLFLIMKQHAKHNVYIYIYIIYNIHIYMIYYISYVIYIYIYSYK